MTADNLTIQQKVRDYLVNAYLPGEQGENLQNDDDLLKVLNSMQLLRMVVEIESTFEVKIDHSELSPENLGSIEKIGVFVQHKMNQ